MEGEGEWRERESGGRIGRNGHKIITNKFNMKETMFVDNSLCPICTTRDNIGPTAPLMVLLRVFTRSEMETQI